MDTYSSFGKANKSYNGFSLAAKDIDWIPGYREAPKAPVYGMKDRMYANVRMFKPKYV